MKIKNILTHLLMTFCLLGCFSCSDEAFVDNPSGEVFIYRLNVVNGGLTGTETIVGEVNEEAKTVSFTIPAETDVEALKVSGKLSLGAKLDLESYDVSSGSAEVRVLNGENIGVYTLNVSLLPATATPLLSKVIVKDDAGNEHEAYVSEMDKKVYLKCEGSAKAEIVSIECLPRRTVTTLTEAANNIISAENPGKITMDFMGLTNEYTLSFEGNPVFGADFGMGSVYDYTNVTGKLWPDFVSLNTRSADFDGEMMLIVSREGGIFPKVVDFASIKAGNPVEKVLNTNGIEGGTYLISAGRISHKHIYISNLKTTKTENLKIYHYANADAAPEVIVDFDGMAKGLDGGDVDISGSRFGDNLSVNLDENGNGYMFLLTQDPGDMMVRFEVAGFTNISNPTFITPEFGAPYYASVNQVGDANEYLFTSTSAPLALIDRDGKALFKLDVEALPIRATDARIIIYDAERYLIMTTGRKASWSGDPDNELLIFNISEGSNTLIALNNFAQLAEKVPAYSYKLNGSGDNACAANTGWGMSPEGNLLIMTAATKAGFAIMEFPEKQ